jgi:DNA polymerase
MAWTERQRAMLEAMGLGLWIGPGEAALASAPEPHRAEADRSTEEPAPARSRTGPPEVRFADPERPREARADDASGPAACTGCPRRHPPVDAVGATGGAWMVVGGAPEPGDVAAGRPFTGPVGALLERMLRAVGAANAATARLALVVRCAGVDGRAPNPAQRDACAAGVREEIVRTRPGVVLALGRTAAQALIGGEAATRWRGHVHRLGGVPIVVTHELPFLLRQPEAKAEAWDDLCRAREALEAQAPPGR